MQISGPVVDGEILEGHLLKLRVELTVDIEVSMRVMVLCELVGCGSFRCIML